MFFGCPVSEASHIESCGLVNLLDFCGVSIQVDPTCVSGMVRSYLSSGTKMYLTWYAGGVVLKAAGKVVVTTGKAVGLGQFINKLGNAVSKYAGSLIKSQGSANSGAYNCARFELYKDSLRAQMSKPHTTDLTFIESDSTAAAIRYELKSGSKVQGKKHLQKGRDLVLRIEKWLRNNSSASPGDRAAAENIIKDTRNALGG